MRRIIYCSQASFRHEPGRFRGVAGAREAEHFTRRSQRHAAVLQPEVRRCTRSAVPVSVSMVDVDSFKQFNDTYGHLVGDDALCAIGRALQGQVVRAGDMLARFGGREFSVVLPGIDRQGAVAVADRLVEDVGNIQVRQASDRQLTVSVGTATWNPGDAPLRPVDLMTRADRALYTAKAAGKNRSASDAEVEQVC